jgi:hypothetical protein
MIEAARGTPATTVKEMKQDRKGFWRLPIAGF